MGGALTAVAPDFTRASLGVPAMNYSVLLPRSVDFDQFAAGPLPVLPERDGAAAGPRPDPDALGPRRAERLRAPDDRRPAAEHAAPPGADERRLRRPPGDRLPGRRRGADDRRRRPPAGPLPGPLARHRRALERALDPTATRTPARRSTTGTPARCAKTRPARGPRSATEPPPYENLPNRVRRRPARGAARRGRRAAARLRLLRRSDPESDDCGGGPCYAGTFTGP